MPTRLKKLQLNEWGLVDKGAGINVPVLITKRREPQETNKNMTLSDILAKLPEADRNVILAALEEAKKTKPPEMTPEMKAAAEPPVGCSPAVKAAWATMPEDLRKVFREQAAAQAEAVEKAKKAEADEREALKKRIAEQEDREEKREYVAKAASLKRVPGLSQDELADTMRAVEKGRALPEALRPKFGAMLKSVDEIVAKSALFGERGSLGRGAEGSPMAKLESVAKQLREKDPTLSQHKALEKAIELNPDLYGEHKNAARAGA